MIKLALNGAGGKMCKCVANAVASSSEFKIEFGIDPYIQTSSDFPIFKSFEDSNLKTDAIIDFSKASSLNEVLDYAIKTKTNLVICTTGHSEEQIDKIKSASKNIPIFYSSNMSIGICLIKKLVKEAAKFLGDDFDIEVVEAHHNQKIDAPSGTAISIVNAINDAKDNKLVPTYDRTTQSHKRLQNEIGIHTIRGGSVVGKHEIMFLGQGENITITHEAESKEIFAKGALKAVEFLSDKSSGLFTMDDLI